MKNGISGDGGGCSHDPGTFYRFERIKERPSGYFVPFHFFL
jgi:hypothetical protein